MEKLYKNERTALNNKQTRNIKKNKNTILYVEHAVDRNEKKIDSGEKYRSISIDLSVEFLFHRFPLVALKNFFTATRKML